MSEQELVMFIIGRLVIVFAGVVCGMALAKYRNKKARDEDNK